MRALPPGWAQLPLGEALRALLDFRGKTPKKLGMNWGNGTIPALSAQNVRQGTIDLSRTSHFGSDALYARWMNNGDPEKGDIVFTTEAPLGNVAQIPDGSRYILSQRVVLMKPIGAFEPRFLAHQMRAPDFRAGLSENETGTTATGIRVSRLVALPVRIAPIHEQHRIADKLDSLLTRIGACRQRLDLVPTTLRCFRQSVLAEATAGELTREWREERGLEDSHYGAPVPLGDVCSESFYGPRFGKNEYARDGVLTIRTTDMTRDGRVEVGTDTPRVRVPPDKLARFALREGDLLITRSGSIGAMATFDGTYVAVPSAYLIRFRFGPAVRSRFVHCCLAAPLGQERLGLSATAVAQPNINAEAIKRIEIPIPSVEEQDEIIRRTGELLTIADRVEELVEQVRKRVARIAPAVLAMAFRGELVPQDPNDEPSSVLLERIHAAGVTARRGAGPARDRRSGARSRGPSPNLNSRGARDSSSGRASRGLSR